MVSRSGALALRRAASVRPASVRPMGLGGPGSVQDGARAWAVAGRPDLPTMVPSPHSSPQPDERQPGAAERLARAERAPRSESRVSDGVRGGEPGESTASAASAASMGASAAERDRDHALVRRAQRADEGAFEELVRRHERRVLRLARNLVPGVEDAQDLSQEAFLRVFRGLQRFDFEHDFTTWLYRIVTNLAIDHLRKRRPTASTSAGEADVHGERERPGLDPVDDAALHPGSELEANETARRVRSCIEALAPHFRVVLTLRELEGMACTEIARIVGATHVTVRWRLHRGRKLFQEEWERRERLAEGAAFLAGERAAPGATREAPRALDEREPDQDQMQRELAPRAPPRGAVRGPTVRGPNAGAAATEGGRTNTTP